MLFQFHLGPLEFSWCTTSPGCCVSGPVFYKGDNNDAISVN